MDRWTGRVALVTGASSGIGAAICRQLVESGMVVIGAARRVERVEALSKELEGHLGTLVAIKCDITNDADIANLFSIIKKEYKGVDVCINNAGITRNYSLLDGTPEIWRDIMNTNVVALCLCTKEAVKSMQERAVDDGHVIHISSVFGHIVFDMATANFYTATKHAVRALTEGLRQELRGLKSNIRVSAISPGLVKTEIIQINSDKETADKVYESMPYIEASDVASSVCHMLAAPPHVQIHDLIIRPTGGMI